jgi:hypothetical protein
MGKTRKEREKLAFGIWLFKKIIVIWVHVAQWATKKYRQLRAHLTSVPSQHSISLPSSCNATPLLTFVTKATFTIVLILQKFQIAYKRKKDHTNIIRITPDN